MIGFLIINYNDAPTTKKLLDNIKNYSCLDKIVVVDNNSTDSSFSELLPYQNEKITILRREDGRQFGAGINYGLRYLESCHVSYTFVSNSDIEIEKESDLQKIIMYRKQGSILAPVIREHTGFNRGWKVPSNGLLLLQSLPFIYRKFMDYNRYSDDYYSKDLLPVEVVSFCFFFVNIRDIRKVGYLDENIFLYFEENVMSCKLQKKGIYLCNEIMVFHNHSVTINKNLNRVNKYRTLSESKRYFAKKYNHAGILIQSSFWMIEKLTLLVLHFSRILHKN